MSLRLPTHGMGLFTLVWIGQFISSIGSAMTGFALGVQIFQDSGSVTRFALLGLVGAIANLSFSPIAGSVADRYDRRLVLIGAMAGATVSNVVILKLIQLDLLTSVYIYPLVAVGAIFASFLWPTMGAAITSMVNKEDLARASGMLQMGGSIASIAGPMLAGLALGPLGLPGIVKLNIVSFLIAIGVLFIVRFPRPRPAGAPPQGAGGPPTGGATPEGARPVPTSGWQFVKSQPALLQLLMTFAFINLAVAMVRVLITPLVLSFSTPKVLGLVVSVASSGALVGGTVMSVWGGPKRRRIALIFAIAAVQGLILILGGWQANATLITVAAFFYLLGFPITTGTSQAIWQTKTPPEIQGRVFAVRRMVAGSSIPLAAAAAGPLVDYVFEPAMAAGGVLAGIFGPLLGTGPGRGIGLLYVLFGAFMTVGAVVLGRSRVLRRLEIDVPDAVGAGADTPRRKLARATTALRLRPALALLALLSFVGVTAAYVGTVPKTVPAHDIAADRFSADRALRHTAAISIEPHPIGSPANAEVRRYLTDALTGFGWQVEVQRTESVNDRGPIASMITVENVVGLWKGHAPDGERRTILLVAHYDTVPSSPGAADNGAAVGVLLETARILSQRPQPRNDIVVLFTDGEEAGLHGASAFVREHPRARDVALTVNFDARGNQGPAYVFETGDDNGWWIPRFADAVPRAAASSIMSAVYDRLPNATDFDVFRGAGMAGFNIAPIGGLDHYHNARDQLDFVDPRTVQHMGGYALSLAEAAADLDLSAPAETRQEADRAYFDLFGFVVHYGAWLAWLSAAVAVVLYLGVIIFGLRRGTLTTFGLGQGFLAILTMLVSLPTAITLVWMVVRDGFGVPMLMGSTEAAPWLMMAFAAFTLVGFVVVQRFFRLSVGVLDLFVGGIGWWLILVVLSSGPVLPVTANFMTVWPFLAAVLLAWWLVATPESRWRSAAGSTALVLGALPALALVPPFAAPVYVALQSLFELGGVPLLPVILMLVLLTVQLEAVSAGRRWLLPGLGMVVGLVLLTSGLIRARHTEPATLSSALYVWDVERDLHVWNSFDPQISPWLAQFGFARGERGSSLERVFPLVGEVLETQAPAVPLPQPVAQPIAHATQGEFTRYQMTLTAPAGSGGRLIAFEPTEAVVAVIIDGETLSMAPPTRLLVRLPVRPVENVTVRVRGDQPVRMIVSEQTPGFPRGSNAPPRGEHDLVRPLFSVVRSDVTFVRSEIELSPAAFATATDDQPQADTMPDEPQPTADATAVGR